MMVKRKGLLAQVNISRVIVQLDNLQNIYKMKKELEFEIECPRCYDSMTLCSDFDSLCYFREQCGFLLHT